MDMTENSGAMSTFLPDGEHCNDVYCEECQCFVKELCWQHATTVHDSPTVPLAVASLPDVLYFAENIDRGNYVYAKRVLRPHTIFGPLITHEHRSTGRLRMENDMCCNWMKFVSVVGQGEEPNLRLLLKDNQVVFVSVKVVLPGEELKLAVEPRYMPMMDPHSAKPTRLGDVHVLFSEDSRSPTEIDSEVLNSSACDVKDIVIDVTVDEYTVCIAASDGAETNFTVETDPSPQFPFRMTVKSEPPRDHSAGHPEPPTVANKEDGRMNSCADPDGERREGTACEGENSMMDDLVDDAISSMSAVGLPTNRLLSIEHATVPREPPSDRESSPEYPFPSFFVASDVAKEQKYRKDSNSDDRCRSPIGRYPFRSRVARDAETHKRNQQEAEGRPIDPVLDEGDEMIDDSDVDADYRLCASDVESSTDSENCSHAELLIPAKRRKSSGAESGKQLVCGTIRAPSTFAAAVAETTSLAAVLTMRDGTTSGVVNLSKERCSLNEQHRQRGSTYPSDIYRFVCPECAQHFFSEQVLQWHRQFQHSDVVDAPWRVGIGCPACKESCVKRKTMVAHVEQHGVKPERIKHFRPTNDPRIMRHVVSPSPVAPDGPTMNHEPHKLCFLHHSSLCTDHACSLRFCSDELAAVHEMQHTPWKPYEGGLQCPGCGFAAENSLQLIEHVTQHGAGREDRKMCRLCGELKGDLQSHMASRHKAEYDQFLDGSCPDKCDQCEKRFPSKGMLKAHVTQSHTVQRVQCFVCAKQFPTSNALMKHSEEHRTDNGLVCPTCQQAFPTYGKFSWHVRKHDVLRMRVCEVCQAVLSSPDKLAQHMLQHTSDYRYRCEPCGKSFKRSTNLSQHNRCVHTDSLKQKRKERKEKMANEGYVCPRRRMDYEDFPHKCQECRLGWLRRGGLEQHRMRKHGAVDRAGIELPDG